MNAAKVLLFSKLSSIYDKLCQTCTGGASADPQIFGGDINVGSEWIRRFLVATLMSGASGSADVTQTFNSNINVWSERSERPISHTAFEFKKIRERQRTPSDRREQLSSSYYSGCDLWLCRFFSFRLSFSVRFSIHNSNYLEKAAFSERSVAGARKCRLFEIIV